MANRSVPLEVEIRRRIEGGGPIAVAPYMELCLTHPERGYYTTGDPFGAQGDFITAPEISQMFGELVGLWAAAVWRAMGSPTSLNLVELGPGRGTMMSDVLRVAKVMPGFRAAIALHLIEISPVLARLQRQALSIADVAAALKASAPPDYAATIQAALERLTDENRTGMGRLFKALAVSDPKLDTLPGFEA